MGSSLELFILTGLYRGSQACFSTISSDENEEKIGIEDDEFIEDKKELEPQGVDPMRGWGFRGVHKVSLATLEFCYIFITCKMRFF